MGGTSQLYDGTHDELREAPQSLQADRRPQPRARDAVLGRGGDDADRGRRSSGRVDGDADGHGSRSRRRRRDGRPGESCPRRGPRRLADRQRRTDPPRLAEGPGAARRPRHGTVQGHIRLRTGLATGAGGERLGGGQGQARHRPLADPAEGGCTRGCAWLRPLRRPARRIPKRSRQGSRRSAVRPTARRTATADRPSHRPSGRAAADPRDLQPRPANRP